MTLDELKKEAFKNPKVKAEYDRLGSLTLDQWRINQNWTWERLARELTYLLKSYGEDALYSNRVWLFRKGKQKPGSVHLRALFELTGNEVESYRDSE